jgi:hypothetical protein
LTVQYIWIGSLYIVQDSEDDWKREPALMMSVFAEAFCNIAATAAVNARTVLFDHDVSIPCAGFLEVPQQPIRPLYGTALTKPFGFIKSIPRTIVKVMAKRDGSTIKPAEFLTLTMPHRLSLGNIQSHRLVCVVIFSHLLW